MKIIKVQRTFNKRRARRRQRAPAHTNFSTCARNTSCAAFAGLRAHRSLLVVSPAVEAKRSASALEGSTANSRFANLLPPQQRIGRHLRHVRRLRLPVHRNEHARHPVDGDIISSLPSTAEHLVERVTPTFAAGLSRSHLRSVTIFVLVVILERVEVERVRHARARRARAVLSTVAPLSVMAEALLHRGVLDAHTRERLDDRREDVGGVVSDDGVLRRRGDSGGGATAAADDETGEEGATLPPPPNTEPTPEKNGSMATGAKWRRQLSSIHDTSTARKPTWVYELDQRSNVHDKRWRAGSSADATRAIAAAKRSATRRLNVVRCGRETSARSRLASARTAESTARKRGDSTRRKGRRSAQISASTASSSAGDAATVTAGKAPASES